MNRVILIGRLTKDPDIRYSGETAVARFTLAVNRYVRNGEDAADFISCVAFGKTAEVAEKYLSKGSQAGVAGRIQTGSYTNRDGQKVYTTDVVVERLELLGSKNSSGSSGSRQPAPSSSSSGSASDGFMSIPDGIDEELPFN